MDASEFIRVWKGGGLNDVNSIKVRSSVLTLGIDEEIQEQYKK
jgi:hypothetical protein